MMMGKEKRFFKNEIVKAIVSELVAGEDEGWLYTAKPDCRDGFSYIEVHDENGEFIAYWTM